MRLFKFIMVLAGLLGAGMSYAADSSVLSYGYSTPWSGGATITLYNNSDAPVAISSLIFTDNTDISGSPWGVLFSGGSSITNSTSADGIHVVHTVTEGSNVQIPAKGSASLTYNIGAINGVLSPYKAAMDPTEVTVIVNGQSQTVSIQNKCSGNACKDPGNGKRIAGYFINWAHWRTPKFDADNALMPYDKMNTLNYAFAIFDKNGNVSLYDQDSDQYNLPIISQKRKQLPYLNASLSFGGWSWASTPPGWYCQAGESPQGPAACFSLMAADDQARAAFVKNAVASMKQVNFNGVDIDWEYPTSVNDAANFVQLIKDLRAALDAQGKTDGVHYNLTIATGAGINTIKVFTPEQWQDIASHVDYIGLMTYDFHGGWDQTSDFQSAMALDLVNDPTVNDPVLSQYNVIDALKNFTDLNHVPANKLVVGIPMYGRMVNVGGALDKPGNEVGLYRAITSVPQGEFDNGQSGSTGVINYSCIVDKTQCASGFSMPSLTLVDPNQNQYGAYSHTPWGYSSSMFITYDDSQSAAYKANWVNQQNFAGVMLWDLTGDFVDTDNRSIVNAIYKAFNNSQAVKQQAKH